MKNLKQALAEAGYTIVHNHDIGNTGDSELVIRPIQKVEKQNKDGYFLQLIGESDTLLRQYLEFTEPQAKAVAAAIVALMDYIHGQPFHRNELVEAARAARQALDEGDE